MHTHDSEAAELLNAITEYAKERMAMDPPPLDNYLSPAELAAAMPVTITEEGIGGLTALDLFVNTLAPASLSTDHPGYLSFIPPAPTEASIAFDLVVSASAIYGGSWVEGSGAVYAENETIAWLVREVGFPEGAGGVFVQGGTIGNLSALVAAREHAKATWPALPARWKVACSVEAHSSLKSAARVMDFDLVLVDSGDAGRMTGAALAAALDAPVEGSPEASAGDGVFAIVATGGTTNFGIVDQLDAIADVANARGIWFHVDGAYGLAGILAETTRPLFKGAERADSFIVDPHKWLFAPFDACALVYRDPEIARKAHTQHAEYLDTLNETGEWNPSDYAVQLTRRPRGLPLWFSLATYGVSAYRTAIQYCVDLTQQVAQDIRDREGFELVRDPELSVVVFTRDGWDLADYNRWSDKLLADGIGFIVPSSHRGKVVMRFALLNPRTTFEEVSAILDSMV